MPSTSRLARTASRKPSASVRNPSALSVPADEYAHAPKPGTTVTPGGRLEHVQRTRDLALATTLRGDERVAAAHVEVVRLARDRVEGRDLLDALADEDPPLADGHAPT